MLFASCVSRTMAAAAMKYVVCFIGKGDERGEGDRDTQGKGDGERGG